MKKLKFLTVLLALVVLNFTSVTANEVSVIRVGLESIYKDVTSALIPNQSISISYSQSDTYYEDTVLSANNNFYFSMPVGYFVTLSNTFNNYSDARNFANSFQNGTVGFLDNGSYNVLISENSIQSANALSSTISGSYVTVIEGYNAVLFDGNQKVVVFLNNTKNPSFRGVNGEYTGVGARKYRGFLELDQTNKGAFTVVNVVPFEEYLYAVVPSEMPASWNSEALKAQAVAARTYATRVITKHSTNGYNLCDREHCQVYLGVTNESQSATNAVIDTRGQKAYYNGSLIETVFYSSSGGVTANSEDVWSSPINYLREKKDIYDTEGLVWNRTVTTSDLSGMLAKAGKNIGTPVGISIDEVSPNGRVNKLSIIGTNGTHSLTKEGIRTFFSYGDKPSLQSRLFNISSNGTSTVNQNITNQVSHDLYITNGFNTEKVNIDSSKVLSNYGLYDVQNNDIFIQGRDSVSSFLGNPGISVQAETVNGTEFTFYGKGYGHGVGLSQYGAKGMAEKGFNYIEILKFYYEGIDVY